MPSTSLHGHIWDTAHYRPIMADYPGNAPQSHSSCLGTVPSPPPRHQTMRRWWWSSQSALLPRPLASRVPRPVENSEGMGSLHTPEILNDYIDFWKSMEDSICLIVIHRGGRRLSWCRNRVFIVTICLLV
jgi:hypothetical protein